MRPAAQLIKFLDGPWETARADLRTDLEHIENLLNSRPVVAGQARLVAGTVVVPTPDIQPGCLVFLSRATTLGTPGHLSYTQVDGVSFTITSSNAADISTVNWLIFDAR